MRTAVARAVIEISITLAAIVCNTSAHTLALHSTVNRTHTDTHTARMLELAAGRD